MSQRIAWTVIAAGALVLLLLLAPPIRARVTGAFERHVLGAGSPNVLKPGDAFPSLSFMALDGSAHVLAVRPNRVSFVNVFATWCPPCRAETPDLVQFARREAGSGVDVIGIDQEESADAVQAFRAKYHAAYPMLIDTGRSTKDVLGARIIPRTIVVDGKGIVRAVVSGPMSADEMLRLAAQASTSS